MAAAPLLDERVALRAAALVAPTRSVEPERARRLRAEVAADLPAVDAAARSWSGLGGDLGPTECRVVSRPGWVRANLAALRGTFDPLADQLPDRRRRVAPKVLGMQLGAVLGLLSTKVLGQYVLPLSADGGGQLVVVGPNLLDLADEHGAIAGDIRRTVLLHEVTHRLQFDGVDWLGPHLRMLVASYLSDARIDPRRLAQVVDQLPDLAGRIREAGSVMPLVEAVLTPHQRDVLDRAQGFMSLLEGHGTAAMYRATDGVVRDPDEVRSALGSRPPDVAGRILTAVAGLEMKKRQYRVGEAFVEHVVDAHGTAGLNRAFRSPEDLPTNAEIADPAAWLDRHGLG